MALPTIFWPSFAGTTVLVLALFSARRELRSTPGLDTLSIVARAFFAAPLAVFGAEHLVLARFIMQAVPAWMPGRLFWAYFVGIALIAAALSIVLAKQVRLSAMLLAVLFFLFVLLIHLPNVAANPRDRILWAVALRDLSFAGGSLALLATQTLATQTEDWRSHHTGKLILLARLCVGIPLIFFSVEHFLHPAFAPGVPLAKMTPDWVPLRMLWGYVTAVLLLVTGVAVLVNKYARTTASWLGAWLTFLTLFLYLPILVRAQSAQALEGVNYVADTLLFAGAVLLLAAAMPRNKLLAASR